MAVDANRLPEIELPTVHVALDGLTTLVDPFDPVDGNGAPWFPSLTGKSSIRQPNEVVPYIDGAMLFVDIVRALRTATKPEHFIYILGWNLQIEEIDHSPFLLVPGDPTSDIKRLLREADGRGVQIRAMLYEHEPHHVARDNKPAVDFINSLLHGSAILDHHVVLGVATVETLFGDYNGAHHQKIIVINGDEGLIAFQGGIDIDADRLRTQTNGQGKSVGLHDVHTRIRGVTAGDLWTNFVERWHDHPLSFALEPVPRTMTDSAQVSEDVQVQIGRTFPNCVNHPLTDDKPPYKFAPTGEQSLRALVFHAIAQARRFIYLEDQYLVDMSVSDALRDALGHIEKLIILITASQGLVAEMKQPWSRRKDFIENILPKAKPNQFAVCFGRTYIHAKKWIFDDKLAIIGSANVNRRGYSHDSEQNASIFDPNTKGRFNFAHELRMNLWAKHFGQGLPPLVKPIDFLDPIASSIHWFSPQPVGDVFPYDRNADTDPWFNDIPGLRQEIWNVGVDPDGT